MTLNEIWAGTRNTTKRCFRPGKEFWVSCGHETVDDAVKDAAQDWPIGIEDLLANDWYVED